MSEFDNRSGGSQNEALHKGVFIRDVTARNFIPVLNRELYDIPDSLEHDFSLLRFLEGACHHFRNTRHSHLVRSQYGVMIPSGELLHLRRMNHG